MALEASTRFEAEAARNPEWRPWLRLLELTGAQVEHDAWSSATVAAVDNARGEPWLHHATVSLDPLHCGAWIRRLLEAAALEDLGAAAGHAGTQSIDRMLLRDFDPFLFLRLAVRQDVEALAGLADLPRDECGALAALSQLAAVPLLVACGRAAAAAGATRGWQRGWCPVCAAWPAFAELRGLDRTRNLRCGRCAADWMFTVLRCPFCDESDHRALGGLVPGEEQPTRRIDTCRTCNGYVKSFTVLRPTPVAAIPLEDLVTVPLDIAAQERGLARPAHPALRLEVNLTAAARPLAAS